MGVVYYIIEIEKRTNSLATVLQAIPTLIVLESVMHKSLLNLNQLVLITICL
jgi:hypothetical protein